jgi:1,5-anhydro-D-fructose reductase (1,5-anhydro-D-mannitol-forming)
MASALEVADGAALVAVCSRDAGRATAFAERHGAVGYGEYAELLADPEVELVYVATPTHLHVEQAIAAAEAGKHVLVEKPMALSVSDATEMAAAAERAGVRLGVGFHLRHHPAHRAMRELIAAGDVGDVVLAQAMWGYYSADWPRDSWKMDPARAGAGSVAALGVHLIDLLRWLVGREVVEVCAVSDGPEQGFPVEFLTAAVLRFEGGALAELVSSRRLRCTDNDVTVHCEGGRLTGLGTIDTEPVGALEIRRDEGTELREPPLRDLYVLEAEACSAAVRTGGELPATAVDGIQSVAITGAVLESGRTGRTVSVRDVA